MGIRGRVAWEKVASVMEESTVLQFEPQPTYMKEISTTLEVANCSSREEI